MQLPINLVRPRALAVATALSLLAPSASIAAQTVPDQASPFTAVRWNGDEPVVQLDGQWYDLVSLDGLTKDEMLAYARKTYGDRWQKRFSEDLVELLRGMGHPPGVEVKLALRLNGQAVAKVGRMTAANRSSVLRFNQAADAGGAASQRPPPQGALPIAAGQQTASQRNMARMMAEKIDRLWDQPPAEGEANLRFLLKKGGQPFAGVESITTEFRFSAQQRGSFRNQGFNPNGKGRWIYEELDPGTYNLTITGTGRFEGFTWSKEGVVVKAGEAPLFEIELPSGGSARIPSMS
jgi:hypothetical protein